MRHTPPTELQHHWRDPRLHRALLLWQGGRCAQPGPRLTASLVGGEERMGIKNTLL